MAGILKHLVFVVYLLILWEASASSAPSTGPHIADVNILLPPRMTHPVEYLLTGSDGCFKWSWDHHDLLSVVPEFNSTSRCSTRARVRSIAPYGGRKETALYATDVNTGIIIRCKVFIDNVFKIRISHNSVKLDLDGLAILRVRGFDDQDNEFSSLVGLKFMWRSLLEAGESSHYLAHVPLKESPLSDCGGLCGDLSVQVKLEESGVFSDLYVVKGIGIGEEKISVHLLENGLKDVTDTINLTVMEAMLLEPPSPVFVIIGASLQYTLKVIRQNFPQVVALPSPHHRWFSANSTVAEVDLAIGLARAHSIGFSSVFVEDVRVSGNILESFVNVVIPQNIYFYVTPLLDSGGVFEAMKSVSLSECWYVIVGRQYLIQTKVFSSGPQPHEIYVTESDDLRLHDATDEYWKISQPNDLLTDSMRDSRIMYAVSQGTGRITASLSYFNGRDQEKKYIVAEQEIRVCNAMKITLGNGNQRHEKVRLPWAPNILQSVALKAIGGCGVTLNDFDWSVSDSSVAVISNSGVIKAIKPGKTTVRVVSVYDPSNYDEVLVEVTVPSSMIMLRNFSRETIIGSHIFAAVTMAGSNGEEFFSCDAFYPFIEWKTDSEIFMVENTTENFSIPEAFDNNGARISSHAPACSWTRLLASSSGQTMLQATLYKDYIPDHRSQTVSVALKASLPISAYSLLTVHQVGDGNKYGGYSINFVHEEEVTREEPLSKLLLAPGTTMDVMLLGGPQPWGDGVEFVDSVKALDEAFAPVASATIVHAFNESQRKLYRVSCWNDGTFYLVFKRGNLIGHDHPVPAIADTTVTVECKLPSSIALIVDEAANRKEVIKRVAQSRVNEERIINAPVAIANGRSVRIAAVGIDVSGNAFANSSSLDLAWDLTGCENVAHWDEKKLSRAGSSIWERKLTLLNESGECIIRASASGFVKILDVLSTQFKTFNDTIFGAVRIQVVTAVRVDPDFTMLYFNPFVKANLSIIGGSCFLETAVNNSNVVEILQPPTTFQCSKVVLLSKGIGTALVTIYDVGLTPPVAVSALVRVADIDWINIVAEDEINIMEGQSNFMKVILGTADGLTFDSCQYAYMNIRVHVEDDIVDVENYMDSSHHSFKLIGRHIGITNIYVSARQQSGLEVISQVVKVEVYATPRVYPGDIFLAPGASYTVVLKGGPTIGASVDYVSLNEEVATVGDSGKLTAMSPGNTKIISRVYRNSGDVLCEAFMTVKVGVPTSAKLNVQSEQLDIGRDMHIHPTFDEGNLFSFYELCKRFKWAIDYREVINFQSELNSDNQSITFNDDMDLGFYQILNGRAAGRAQVSVTFTCNFTSSLYSQRGFYNASLSLLVVPGLPISLGSQMTRILPPYYTSSSLLPSSQLSFGDQDRKVHKGTVFYSIIKNCGEKGKWQHDPVAIEGDKIKTLESGELACIQGRDRANGRAEIAFCVRVAEVAQIRINYGHPFRRVHLAVGDQIGLQISYFDVLGNEFYEACGAVYFEAETNYHDVVEVDSKRNGSNILYLKGRKRGQALVRVMMNNNPAKADYILISVGVHLLPENPKLSRGDYLQFSVEGTDKKATGRWFSVNGSVLSIHSSLGKAEAVGVGSTQVSYESEGIRLQTSVTVSPSNALSVHASNEIVTNIGDALEGYKFFVKFSGVHGLKEKTLDFTCKVEPEFIGYAQPRRDLAKNNYYCLLFPYSPERLVQSLPKLRGRRPYLSISVSASLRNSNISADATALFVGGFSVIDDGQSMHRIDLSAHVDSAIITILGNTDVSVHWNDRSFLDVKLLEREDLGFGGRARYEVKMLGGKRGDPLEDAITIAVPATGQKHEIRVHGVPSAASERPLGDALSSPILIMVALSVLVIVALLTMFEITKRSQHSPARRPLSASAPVTPEHSRPALADASSPRTPQQFMEYVRKTIDETPYYRREARRRFNVQNTM